MSGSNQLGLHRSSSTQQFQALPSSVPLGHLSAYARLVLHDEAQLTPDLQFLVESHHRNDASQMFMFLNWYLNRWLGFRFELLSVCLTAAAGLFVVLKRDMAPGLAGFTLAVVQKGGTDMMWLFRQLTYAEVAMVSVERLQEYTQLPPEPDTPVEQVPASWPERGEISVEGLSVRYSPGLPQILKNVSFRAAAGQKIGIVGATGSGKSTLALSFFRFVTADAGQITIDGVDTSKISLFDLRSRLCIVPQEPVRVLTGGRAFS